MRYRLATYRECKAHREWNTTCPSCGRRGKFSPYIDTVTMRPVDDRTCGRCNRLSNCGYHLPPREMPRNEDFGARHTDSSQRYSHANLANHAKAASQKARSLSASPPTRMSVGCAERNFSSSEECSLLLNSAGGHTSDSACASRDSRDLRETKNNQREANEFYEKMRRACEQSQPWGSHLVTWLRTQFPRDAVAAALKRYRVGGTPDGATLWWQIDTQGRVHTGKAMLYNPLTGHRVKEGTPSVLRCSQARLLGADTSAVVATDAPSRRPPLWGEGSAMAAKPLHRGRGWGGSSPVNWAHRMRLYGEPSDLVVPQCLFGLSLLNTEHTALTTDYTDFSDSLQDGHSTPHEENPCNPRNPLSLTTDYTDFSDSLQDGHSTPHEENPCNPRNPLSLTTDYTDVSDSLHDGRSTPHEGNPCNPRNLWSNSPWSEKIGVVESEKTALIMSLVCPDHVWLATGGKQGFKEQMLAPLIGLEVAVYPDADALHDWYARIVEMNRTLGTRLHIPTWYYNLMDHPEAIARGLDLADILMGGWGGIGAIDAIVPIDTIDTIVPIDAIGSQP